jgi:hypothetical protein
VLTLTDILPAMMPAIDHAMLPNWEPGYEHGIDSESGASTDHEADGNSAVARRIGGDGEPTREAGTSAGSETETNDVCGCAKENRNGAAEEVEKNQGREEIKL